MYDNALSYLRKSLDHDDATFRDGQSECISALLERKRLSG